MSGASRLTIIGEGAGCSVDNTPLGAAVVPSDYAGNVALVTLGCAKNLVDSEIMLGALMRKGFRPVDDAENADLIVVNTCAFLESAVQEGIDTILDLSKYKEQRCRKLVVAGCMVERYRSQLEQELPEVDRFISTDELLTVGDEESSTTEQCFDSARRPYFLYDETMPRVLSTGSHSAFVKVSEGCDRPCSFCIIPKIRGAFRSRSVSSIAGEVSSLLGAGVREINFVAQDLTAYGTDFPESRSIRSHLPELLEALGLHYDPAKHFWLRLLYAYPVGVTEALVKQIRDLPYLANYLDLPLQHISHGVLKSMRRPLGEKGTRTLIEKIRAVAPEVSLRTTFIVGYPGETAEDVRSLLQFVSEGHFAHIGVFTYSQESESVAFHFDGQIPEEEKAERRDRVMELQQSIVAKRLGNFIGKRLNVLVDGQHPETNLLLSARAEWQAPETDGEIVLNEIDENLSFAENPEEIFGRFVDVEVTEVHGYDLIARVVSGPP